MSLTVEASYLDAFSIEMLDFAEIYIYVLDSISNSSIFPIYLVHTSDFSTFAEESTVVF